MHSQAVILDEMPKSYRPIVQDIDNYDCAHKLGIIFGTRAAGLHPVVRRVLGGEGTIPIRFRLAAR